MELNGAKILYTIHTDIPLLGDFKITQTLVSTWIVMALLSGLAIWLGRNLKLENVSKRQAAAEFIVERLDQFVHDNMGYHFDKYIPLIGAIFALSIGCNLISVIGLWSPTADLNTEAAWAIVVFVLIMYYKIKTNGILSYLKGLLDPIFIMPWGLGMGAAGAGMATFLSNCFACLYFMVLLFIKRGRTYVCIDPRKLSFDSAIVGGVCMVGIPAAIQNNANPTILFTDTHLLFVHYMYTATKNVCYFSASSRILFTSSSVTLSSFRDVKRSITSGTISNSFVIVS